MKPYEFDDDALESPAQRQMQDLVFQLPEESLSLAWRSSLNEKLLATQVKPKRNVWNFLRRPAVGLAFAGALALVVVVRGNLMTPPADVAQPTITQTSGNLEAALVRDHQDMVQISDVVGAGLNPDETTPTKSYSVDTDWSDYDLDSL